MCVVSMVYEHFSPRFPAESWTPPTTQITFSSKPEATPEQWRKLIEDFWAALEAAKVVDKATGQPDCEDPAKAELEKRVADLERRLVELERASPRKSKAKKSRKRQERK